MNTIRGVLNETEDVVKIEIVEMMIILVTWQTVERKESMSHLLQYATALHLVHLFKLLSSRPHPLQ